MLLLGNEKINGRSTAGRYFLPLLSGIPPKAVIFSIFCASFFLFFTPQNAYGQSDSCCYYNAPIGQGDSTCRVEDGANPCQATRTEQRIDTTKCGDLAAAGLGAAFVPVVGPLITTAILDRCSNFIVEVSIPYEETIPCGRIELCRQEAKKLIDCGTIRTQGICTINPICFWFGGSCHNRSNPAVCNRITDQNYCGTSQGSSVCEWQDGLCISKVEAGLASQYTREGGILPKCAYAGTCRSVNDLLLVLVTIVREAFKYIGSIAFFFFVFAGITIVLSFGNPEKVKKGNEMLMAAVIGILISFGAYVLVDFILDALQVAGTFRG